MWQMVSCLAGLMVGCIVQRARADTNKGVDLGARIKYWKRLKEGTLSRQSAAISFAAGQEVSFLSQLCESAMKSI